MSRANIVTRTVVLGLACLWLADCAPNRVVRPAQPPYPQAADTDSSSSSVSGHYKIGEPYQIKGTWYYPNEDYAYREIGVASWYGPGFHGEKTANGGIYDQNDITAAHRTLPMPSYVRVTHLSTGRTLKVMINDRGPFANDRIIDLSRRSAQLLGFENAGTATVQVEILADESMALKNQLMRTSVADAPKMEALPRMTVARENLAPIVITGEPLPPPKAMEATSPIKIAKPERPIKTASTTATTPATVNVGTFVMAASFGNSDNAERLAVRLRELAPTKVLRQQTGSRTLYRVRLGPIEKGQNPQNLLQRVRKAGFPDARVVTVD